MRNCWTNRMFPWPGNYKTAFLRHISIFCITPRIKLWSTAAGGVYGFLAYTSWTLIASLYFPGRHLIPNWNQTHELILYSTPIEDGTGIR